jgi:two-component system CheB/CheR fusion protein
MLEASANNPEHLEVLKNLNLTSAMLIPMMSKGRIMGAVCFLSSNPLNLYDEYDFSFAKDFTNRIALTLENARLYEEVRKDIEQRIEADKRKDEFISIASHELKTPVTSLKAYAQILEQTFNEENNVKAAGMLSKMNNQIDKLTGLIIDMLDITKIDTGEIQFNMEEFAFNDLVKEIADEMQATTKHTINLQLKDCARVKGDKNRIAQVVTNFVSNAIKYSPHAREIIISTDCENDQAKLSVRDFGIGIPKHEQPKLFTRFYRVTGKNKEYTFPGLGLGLYISSEIIKRHSGKIEFESVEGEGSSFGFHLPILES